MSLLKINYHQYCNVNINSPFSIDGVGFEPELILNTYPKNLVYSECPSWKHKASRTFLIRSPVNIGLFVDVENENISSNLDEWHFDQYISKTFEQEEWSTSERKTIQLSVPRFLFWTNHKNVWVEVRPHYRTAIDNNFIAINAWFNMSSWVRPVHCAFDIIDTSKNVTIRRGDPLMEVCFYSDNLDSGILLKKSEPPDDILKRIEQNATLKDHIKKFSNNLIFKQQKSKCPFHHLWK